MTFAIFSAVVAVAEHEKDKAVFLAARIKPQARVFAESRGVECVEVDLGALRGDAPPDLQLF